MIITKFSHEIIQVELAVFSLFASLALYWLVIKRRKRETSEWVPAAIVKEYLDRMAEDERQTRYRLFGITHPHQAGAPLQAAAPVAGVSMDPSLLREIESLRAQLAAAGSKTGDVDKTVNALKEEKKVLEQKLKDAEAAKGTGGGGVDPNMVKELEELRARLKEYEIIEDDLANLKKFQAENKDLKDKLAALQGGAPAPVAAAPVAAAPAPAPVAEAPAAAAPAPKKESELLSEFEKMLAS